jgi:hypothetical protein
VNNFLVDSDGATRAGKRTAFATLGSTGIGTYTRFAYRISDLISRFPLRQRIKAK